MIKKLEAELFKLKLERDRFKKEGYKYFFTGKNDALIVIQLNEALEHVTIMPTDLDPNKIIPKIKSVLEMREEFFENFVKKVAPDKSKCEGRNLEATVELLAEVEMLYKIARHWFMMAKKTNDQIFIFQANMIIQQIKMFFPSLKNALIAMANGLPIGDAAGPMVAQKLGEGQEWKEITHNTVMTEIEIDGHWTYIIKAEGSGSTVGKVNEALKKIIDSVDIIIMCDAALKAGGDISGEVAIGEGAAIGGFGVEKFEIEEMAIKRNIPLYAVLIKESFGEALGFMSREVAYGVTVAVAKIKKIISEQPKDKVIVVIGVGNTGGIGQ